MTKGVPTQPATEGASDVPAQVFGKFLQDLEGAGISTELIARLRKTLLEDKSFTDRALRKAVLGEEPLA